MRNPQNGTNDAFPRLFRFRNIGNVDFVLSNIFRSGLNGDQSHFTAEFVGDDRTVEPGEERDFVISFHPQDSGTFSANIAVVGTNENVGPEGSGTSFQVRGIGADPNATAVLEVTAPTPGNPVISSGEPQSVGKGTDFGTPTAGSLIPREFTLTNLSDQRNLTLASSFAPEGSAFNVELGASDLAPGASTTLTVTFDPDFGSPGQKGGIALIETNDPNADPFIFLYTGTTPGRTDAAPEIVGIIRSGVRVELELLIENSGPTDLESSSDLSGPWEVEIENVTTGFETLTEADETYFYRLNQR